MRRRLTGEKRGSFARGGSNWFARGAASASVWREDVALLVEEHAALRHAAARLRAADLAGPLGHLVRGAAAHDLYHAGQIQLLKRLFPH